MKKFKNQKELFAYFKENPDPLGVQKSGGYKEYTLEEIAKHNAKLNGVLNNIDFIESNLFDKIKNIKFDIIVSNPPYIPTDEIKRLPKDVRQEPIIALDGGKDGLEFYKKIFNKGNEYLNRQGYLCVEIGYNQKETVKKIIDKKERYVQTYCIKDLCQNDRVIVTQIG